MEKIFNFFNSRSSEVLEHVEEPWAFVAYCSNLVKQDGDLIFTTINRTIQSRILAIELAERIAGLLPRGTHDWEKFVTVEELIMDLREVKFRVEDIKGDNNGRNLLLNFLQG